MTGREEPLYVHHEHLARDADSPPVRGTEVLTGAGFRAASLTSFHRAAAPLIRDRERVSHARAHFLGKGEKRQVPAVPSSAAWAQSEMRRWIA